MKTLLVFHLKHRDFPRLYSLAESWALLNFIHRERTSDGACIYANVTDIEVAKKIYEPILKCNELGLTPEEFEVWKIVEPFSNDPMGLRISEVHNIYFNQKKRRCSDKRLREMLKNFCSAGLLKEEKEGQVIKYYEITHKETKQSEITKPEANQKQHQPPFSLTQNNLTPNNLNIKQPIEANQQTESHLKCPNCNTTMTYQSATGLCDKCELDLAKGA